MSTNIYEESAQKAWEAIVAKVKTLEATGLKRAEIARRLGHAGRSAVTNWLDESATPKTNLSFPTMLRYLDALGLNIYDYLPDHLSPQTKDTTLGQFEKRVDYLEKALAAEKEEKVRLQGEVSALERLFEKTLKQIQEQSSTLPSQQSSLPSSQDDREKTLKVV